MQDPTGHLRYLRVSTESVNREANVTKEVSGQTEPDGQ